MNPEDIKVGQIYRWRDDENSRFIVNCIIRDIVTYTYASVDGKFNGNQYSRYIKSFWIDTVPVYTVEGFEI